MDNMTMTQRPSNIKTIRIILVAQNVREQIKASIHDEFHSASSFKTKAQAFKKITGITWQRYNLHKPITFQGLQHNNNHFIIRSSLTVSSFRAMLKQYYLTEKKIPSLNALNDSSDNLDVHIDRKDTSRAFILKMLPGLTKGIIIEDPEIVYKRILYLKKMQQIRKDNIHIVYVTKTKCDSALIKMYKLDNQFDIFMCVSTRIGLLRVFFCRAEDVDNSWISGSISTIAGPCAILMEEQDLGIPTQSSPKADLSRWLTDNGVLHDPTAHRGEMYELIQKTVVNGQMMSSKIDDTLIAEGHQVVKYPKYAEEIDFFDRLFSEINKSICDSNSTKERTANVFDVVKSLTLSEWQQYESGLIEKETSMLREDMMMEKVIDNLCMMAADGKLPKDMKASLIDAVDLKNITSSIIFE